jgi:curli production assembly/transport component CsgG
VDQVTKSLRAVDVRTGQVLANVMTSKTIYAVGRSAGVFKFIEFKKLLEAEVGYTTNEPAQLCVLSAIEPAVGHLLAQGIERRLWQVGRSGGWQGDGGQIPESESAAVIDLEGLFAGLPAPTGTA